MCGGLIYSFTRGQIGGIISPMPVLARPTKITFGDMRDMGVRGLLIYCSDYKWKSTAPADHQMIDDRQ